MKARRWDAAKMVEGVGSKKFTRQIAFHEAGHALTAVLQGYRFDYVTIIPDGLGDFGHCAHPEMPPLRWKNTGSMARAFNNAIRGCLAGIAGEIAGTRSFFFPKNAKDAVHMCDDLNEAIRYAKMFKKRGGVLTAPSIAVFDAEGKEIGELFRDVPIPDTIRRYLEYQAYRVSLNLGDTYFLAFEHLGMVLLEEKYLEWKDVVNIVRGH